MTWQTARDQVIKAANIIAGTVRPRRRDRRERPRPPITRPDNSSITAITDELATFRQALQTLADTVSTTCNCADSPATEALPAKPRHQAA